LSIGGQEVVSLIDTGAEGSIMSEQLFSSLESKGVNFFRIPTTNCVLTTAFGRKSKRIKKQTFLEFDIDGDRYEQSAFVVPDLISDITLGADFLNENQLFRG
jgi:hypothetical protein